jgi:hypothetical protein
MAYRVSNPSVYRNLPPVVQRARERLNETEKAAELVLSFGQMTGYNHDWYLKLKAPVVSRTVVDRYQADFAADNVVTSDCRSPLLWPRRPDLRRKRCGD